MKTEIRAWDFAFRLVLFLCFALISIAASHTAAAQSEPSRNIALEVYLYDDLAFDRRSQDLFEGMIGKLRPDLGYRRVSIKASLFGWHKERVNSELRERLASVLEPGERISILLINTHGQTIDTKENGKATELSYMGHVFENGADAEFSQTFSAIQNRATLDLRIILNSCSVFCGGVESAAQRGRSILNFFGASNGGIYGADVVETSQVFDDPEFFKWKYLVPSFKSFWVSAVLVAAATYPTFLPQTADVIAEQINTTGSMFELFSMMFAHPELAAGLAGSSAGTLVSILRPITEALASRFYSNRGYFFALENGELAVGQKVIKYQEMANLIANGRPSARCETLFIKSH